MQTRFQLLQDRLPHCDNATITAPCREWLINDRPFKAITGLPWRYASMTKMAVRLSVLSDECLSAYNDSPPAESVDGSPKAEPAATIWRLLQCRAAGRSKCVRSCAVTWFRVALPATRLPRDLAAAPTTERSDKGDHACLRRSTVPVCLSGSHGVKH